mmetsp:Transcript_28508/g.37291  ORF Transcript_28508/g.37291 Transcript_28508/m.37291 type:complete len:150 (+) Transcript_28508:298-747(+)
MQSGKSQDFGGNQLIVRNKTAKNPLAIEQSAMVQRSQTPDYIGLMQKHPVRMPKIPSVKYDKGGDDFRTVLTSSMGKQTMSRTKSHEGASFGGDHRFRPERSRSPGPKYGYDGSLQKQVVSKRRSPSKTSFGTSTRDDAAKCYGIWNYK